MDVYISAGIDQVCVSPHPKLGSERVRDRRRVFLCIIVCRSREETVVFASPARAPKRQENSVSQQQTPLALTWQKQQFGKTKLQLTIQVDISNLSQVGSPCYGRSSRLIPIKFHARRRDNVVNCWSLVVVAIITIDPLAPMNVLDTKNVCHLQERTFIHDGSRFEVISIRPASASNVHLADCSRPTFPRPIAS